MSVSISISGFEKFNGIENLEEKINKGLTEFTSRLGEIGKDEANRRYRSAEYEGDNDVDVNFNMIGDHTGRVSATGESVLFIEYGTGVKAIKDEDGNYGEDSWSSTHKRMYHDKGYWWYNKHMIEGQQPARAMYEAEKEIINKAQDVAKEVFKW